MAASSSSTHMSTARHLQLRLSAERANGAATVAAAALGLPRREARVALRAHARRIEAAAWKVAAAGVELRTRSGRRGEAAVCAAAGQVAGRSAGVGRSAGMEVALATAAVIAMGTGNRVLYKLALVPLRQYPFFLAQFATFGYVVVYFSILYLRYQAGTVTDEMLSLPQKPFILVGLLEALAAASGMAAGAVLSGASIPILSQTYLVWQLLLSAIFLKRRYKVNEITGCFLVTVGVVITVASGSGAGASLQSTGILWPLLMIISFFLQAADTVLKEIIFIDAAKNLKGGSVDLFVVNSYGSAYQAVFMCLLLPFLSKLWGIPFHLLPTYIRDGAACFLNMGSLSSGCEGAPLLPLLFVLVNMGFNISLLHLLKISSAVVSCLASTFSGSNSRKRTLWIIAVAAPLLSILMCLIGSVLWTRRRKGKVNLQDQAATSRPEEDALVWRLEEKSSEFTLFDFSEILHATCNFSIENLLGRGGFGPVYKGQLSGGMEIAVKRLASHSGQGFTEFKNEVELIAKLQHNNLVKLLGCCIQGEEKLLVYEYLPNKSLDFIIFDGNKTTLVDWNKRRVIIEGIAQGLLYLHKHSRLRIIHRDLKASNILLDQDMTPKISDFGLAKIFSSNDTQGSTKRVVGTYGYMSPEYASEGIYSIKSDVFSFGVLLLEIISGKRNSGFHHEYGEFLNLLGYSWQLWEGGRWLELLESSIAKDIHTTEARRYINIALMCVQENADDRPTMSEVVAMLNSESVVLPEPNHPAYFNLKVSKVHESAGDVAPCSNNDVTITAEPDGR